MNITAYSGHAPGHVRDAFAEAVEEFYHWNGDGCEPTVTFEIDYEPHQIPLSEACILVWNCTDIMPSMMVQALRDDLDFKKLTYAAGARAMRAWLKKR